MPLQCRSIDAVYGKVTILRMHVHCTLSLQASHCHSEHDRPSHKGLRVQSRDSPGQQEKIANRNLRPRVRGLPNLNQRNLIYWDS